MNTNTMPSDPVFKEIARIMQENPPKSQFELMQARRKGTRKVYHEDGYRIVVTMYKGKIFILEAAKTV